MNLKRRIKRLEAKDLRDYAARLSTMSEEELFAEKCRVFGVATQEEIDMVLEAINGGAK